MCGELISEGSPSPTDPRIEEGGLSPAGRPLPRGGAGRRLAISAWRIRPRGMAQAPYR
jgi:hypothetical protein